MTVETCSILMVEVRSATCCAPNGESAGSAYTVVVNAVVLVFTPSLPAVPWSDTVMLHPPWPTPFVMPALSATLF